jgi:hypothetical protein
VSLDEYGGVTSVACSKGPAAHFYTEKIGDRWWLCDPAGHGFFMKGLVGVYPSWNNEQANLEVPTEACWGVGKPAPCCTGVGASDGACKGKYWYGIAPNPYVDNPSDPQMWQYNWAIQQINRLKAWGFNTIADNAHAMVWPTSVNGSWNTADNTLPAQFRMPFDIIKNTTNYALTNQAGCNLSSPIKDMLNGLTAANKSLVYYDFGDYFDPNYANCVNGQANPANDKLLNNAAHGAHNDYLIYITLDEGDQAGFSNQGPDFPTVGNSGVPNPGHAAAHPGWVTLTTAPTQNSNSTWGATYPDHEVYSKVEFANELLNKYMSVAPGTYSIDPAAVNYAGGSIMATALNRVNNAWGSAYTTLSTSDVNCSSNLANCLQSGSYASYGTGTGLLDENGSHSWVGNNITLAGETAAMQADLSTYLTSYLDRYYGTLTNAFHTYEPGVLLQMTIGGWGAPPRREVLREAGKYLDIIQESFAPVWVPCPACSDIQQRINFTFQYLGDHPTMIWEGFFANPDSSESAHVRTDNIAATQEGRGAAYQQMLTNLLNAKDMATGTYHNIGFYWWDEFDMDREGLNWGLVSVNDNPYDGCSATIAGCGLDQWGYPTGGETANYGDVLSYVTNANNSAISNMAP